MHFTGKVGGRGGGVNGKTEHGPGSPPGCILVPAGTGPVRTFYGKRSINFEPCTEPPSSRGPLSDRAGLERLPPRAARHLGRAGEPPHASASRARLPRVPRRLRADRPARRPAARPEGC